MKPGRLRILLGIALPATLLAAYFAPPLDGDEIALSERSRATTPRPASEIGSTAPSATAAKPVEVLNIRAKEVVEEDDAAEGVFATTQWTPPAPKVTAKPVATQEEAPPPPQAPPLPFRVLGRYVKDGQVVVFLQHNDQNLVVRVGDTIAEHYKVERLNGGTLTLRYTPLNQEQTLEIGGST